MWPGYRLIPIPGFSIFHACTKRRKARVKMTVASSTTKILQSFTCLSIIMSSPDKEHRKLKITCFLVKTNAVIEKWLLLDSAF